MHPDRSCPLVPRAADRSHQPEESDRASRLDPSCGAQVVGLGAPLSVRIRLSSCEIPLLRAQVHRSLQRARSPRPTAGDEPAIGVGDTHVWEEMLDQLADPQTHDPCVEVLWPTAFAFPVLRAAADDALDAVAQAPRDNCDLDAVAAVLRTAQCALDTLRAFVAVDFGGLDQVTL